MALDLARIFRDLEEDDCECALSEHDGCRFGGRGSARRSCMALVADFSFRGGCPASMVIRTP